MTWNLLRKVEGSDGKAYRRSYKEPEGDPGVGLDGHCREKWFDMVVGATLTRCQQRLVGTITCFRTSIQRMSSQAGLWKKEYRHLLRVLR